MATRVAIESGSRRVFAVALDWPGWARSARSEAEALAALSEYADRYAPVARAAGLEPPGVDFEVVERVGGNASTDFGVPGAVTAADRVPLKAAEANRLCSLLAGAWLTYDRALAIAPAELRKGPRGGGRDRDRMAAHVDAAEAAYLPKVRPRIGTARPSGRAAVREAFRSAILARSTAGDWPPRYAARRVAWHVLDHAWEMEDRARPAPAAPPPSRPS